MAPGGNLGGDLPGYPQIITPSNVIDINRNFPVYPNQARDSAPGINAALQALGSSPGLCVFSKGGVYQCNSTINIGNGTQTSVSTQNGIGLVGYQSGGWFHDSYAWGNPVELKANFAGGDLVRVNGPIFGWTLDSLRLNCNSSASRGLHQIATRSGWISRVAIIDALIADIITEALRNDISGLPLSANSTADRYRDISLRVPLNAFAKGCYFDGNGHDTQTNTWGENFENVFIEMPTPNTTVTTYGIYFRDCDNISFRNLYYMNTGITGSGQNLALMYDFNGISAGGWPADTFIEKVDFATSAAVVVYNGSPAANVTVNRVVAVSRTNSQPANPALTQLFWGYANASP